MGGSKGSSQRGPDYARIENARANALEAAAGYRQQEAEQGARLQQQLLEHSLGQQLSFYRNLAPDIQDQQRFQQTLWTDRARTTSALAQELERGRTTNQASLIGVGAEQDRARLSLASALAREEAEQAQRFGLQGASFSSDLARGEARLASDLRINEAQAGKDIQQALAEQASGLRTKESLTGRDIQKELAQQASGLRINEAQAGKDIQQALAQQASTLRIGEAQVGKDIEKELTGFRDVLQRGQNLQRSNLARQENTQGLNLQLALRREHEQSAGRNRGLSQFGLNRKAPASTNYLDVNTFGVSPNRVRRRKANGFARPNQ